MAEKTVSIGWNSKTNTPYAPDVSVDLSEGQTTIKWEAAANSGITEFYIESLDTAEFTGMAPASGTYASQVTVNDLNNSRQNKDYTYNIKAKHSNGTTGQHDPKISNVGRGG